MKLMHKVNGLKGIAVALALLTTTASGVPVHVAMSNGGLPTLCAEADNVATYLRHPAVTSFHIRATHPVYPVLVEAKEPNFTDCDFTGDPVFPFAAPFRTLIHHDGITDVVAVRDASNWIPSTMTAKGGLGQVSGVHHIAVYRQIADEPSSFPEILVVYVDGNVRMKPQARPPLLDNVFGSSFLVGPISDLGRPAAVVAGVEYVATQDAVRVTYVDGSTALLTFEAIDRMEFRIRVDLDRAHPGSTPEFFGLRSMYVSNTNCDVELAEFTHASGLTGQVVRVGAVLAESDMRVERAWFGRRSETQSHNRSAPDIEVYGFDAPHDGEPPVREGIVGSWADLHLIPLGGMPGTVIDLTRDRAAFSRMSGHTLVSATEGFVYFGAVDSEDTSGFGSHSRCMRIPLWRDTLDVLTQDLFGNSQDGLPIVSRWHPWMIFVTNRSGTYSFRSLYGHRMGGGVPNDALGLGEWATWDARASHAFFAYVISTTQVRVYSFASGTPVLVRTLPWDENTFGTPTRLESSPVTGQLLVSNLAEMYLMDPETGAVIPVQTSGAQGAFAPDRSGRITFTSDIPGVAGFMVSTAYVDVLGLVSDVRRVGKPDRPLTEPCWFRLPEEKLGLRVAPTHNFEISMPLWSAERFVLESTGDLLSPAWSAVPAWQNDDWYVRNATVLPSDVPGPHGYFRLRSGME